MMSGTSVFYLADNSSRFCATVHKFTKTLGQY